MFAEQFINYLRSLLNEKNRGDSLVRVTAS